MGAVSSDELSELRTSIENAQEADLLTMSDEQLLLTSLEALEEELKDNFSYFSGRYEVLQAQPEIKRSASGWSELDEMKDKILSGEKKLLIEDARTLYKLHSKLVGQLDNN